MSTRKKNANKITPDSIAFAESKRKDNHADRLKRKPATNDAKANTANQVAFRDLKRKIDRKIRDIGKRGYVPKDELKKLLEQPKKITKKKLQQLEEVRKDIYKHLKYYDPLKEVYIKGEERREQERVIAARKGWEERRRKEALKYYEENRRPDQFEELVKKRQRIKAAERLQEPPEADEEYYDNTYNTEYDSIPREAERIMYEVIDMIDNWSPSPTWSSELQEIKKEDRNKLYNIVHGAINEFGFDQCVRNIASEATWFRSLCQQVLFESGNKFKASGREGVRWALNQIMTIIRGRPLTVQEAMDIEDISEDINTVD